MFNTSIYQSKGRSHIKYINRLARNIWRDYNCRDNEWKNCIKRALKQHVIYLRKVATMDNSSTDGSWYRDNKSGLWIKL